MSVNSYLLDLLTPLQEFNDKATLGKKRLKRRWWQQKAECSPAATFAFSIFLLSNFSTVSSYSNNKNWKTNDNGFLSEYGVKNLHSHYKDNGADNKIKNIGGTRWATAREEANDELHDAEILRAVQKSIAEWEERRRNRNAKKKQYTKLRTKRSQPEKVEVIDDDENKEPTKVCYAELGCFEEAGYIDLLPNSPEEVNTRYLLYNSRRSRGDTPLLDVSAQNVSSLWEWVGKAFNVSSPTKVIVHGFGSSCSNVWVYEMRSALMSVEDCNIICVDWENGATIPNYVRAAANTRLVGKQLAILLSGLEKYVNLSVRNVHMIGFSLGAHVAGFAGSELKNLSRITGLDPAGPLFESQDRRARLDSMDAQFVDVIHSNGENLILGGLGAWQPMGHVDFYPNGGRMQKGCTNLFVGAVSDMIWSANEVYGRSLCNHRRAYKFFTDSVSPKCQFPAVPCESYDHFLEGKCFPCQNFRDCNNMGYYADKFPGRGTLYLLTRDEEPFCANQYMVKIENSALKEPVDKKPITFGKLQIVLIGDLELNETFTITQKRDEKLTRGESVSRIIVPHPALQNFLKIQVTYMAYKGWLSSGEPSWRINKISLINSYGQILSACREDLELESGIPVILQLIAQDCNGNGSQAKPNKTTKPADKVNEANEFHLNETSDSHLYPHTQVIKLGNEILTMDDITLSSALNSGLELINSSSLTEDNKHNPVLDNTSKIGIGVTEYINDSWKQKPEFLEPVVNVSNHLDNRHYDYGEGRHLASSKKDIPIISNITEIPYDLNIHNKSSSITEINFVSLRKEKEDQPTPYEFITEQLAASDTISFSTKIREKTELEITEPVLKPKAIQLVSHPPRIHKSQNTFRPNYGKSIHVESNKSQGNLISATLASRKSLNLDDHLIGTTIANYVNASLTNTRSTTIPSEDGKKLLLDPLSTQSAPNSRALKKNYESEFKNSSTQLFVVQFLPQKLISFFEQAERYARMAFLPFITSPETSKTGVSERARRIRTFNTNRWTSSTNKDANEKSDMETDESMNIVLAIATPSMVTPAASFPYTYYMPKHELWQPISRYPDGDRKYIPLAFTEPNTKFSGIPYSHTGSSISEGKAR